MQNNRSANIYHQEKGCIISMLTLNGVEVIPLSKIVKELCLKQGNLKETGSFQQLVYARWAWKELFRKYIWQIRNQVLTVDCDTHTIQLPPDCERLINIYVIDRQGKLEPLTCDPGLNTVEIKCIVPPCSCTQCKGEGTLCAAAEAGVTYTTETVTIQDVDYTMQVWVRYNGNGAIQRQRLVPTLNSATNTVVISDQIETICNIETTEKGCIKPTPSNMEALRSFCGCATFPETQTGRRHSWYNNRTGLVPQPYNYYGYWNVNAADSSLIHIFRYDRTLGNIPKNLPNPDNVINKVIVSYQTNGEVPGDEIMVPQYAQMAMDAGIMWQQKFFNTRMGANEKEYAKQQFMAARLDLNKHLNPIRMEDIAKLQTQLRRW